MFIEISSCKSDNRIEHLDKDGLYLQAGDEASSQSLADISPAARVYSCLWTTTVVACSWLNIFISVTAGCQ